MPLYDYECQQCHRHTEKIQKFSDAPLTECPHCGGHLERVLHAPAVAFKGGGWYADGYGNSKPKAGGDGKAGESKSEGKSSESKSSESKSDSGAAKTSSDTSSSSTNAPSSNASPTAASTPAASSSSSDKK
ncbi:MAG TPA: zinc ribbon domain-containing protein [Terriglobales bacterium]|nr:zinc ribbon domain-containing protein [Terriglobales bacterium]